MGRIFLALMAVLSFVHQAEALDTTISMDFIKQQVAAHIPAETSATIDGIGPDYTIYEGKLVPAVGVYIESKKDVAKCTGYVLFRLQLIPMMVENKLTIRQKVEIADVRIKVGGFVEYTDNILSCGNILDNPHIDSLIEDVANDFIETFRKSMETKGNSELAKKDALAPITSLSITPAGIKLVFGFPPGDGPAKTEFTLDDSLNRGCCQERRLTEWWPAGHSKADAALVVTLFYDALQLHTVASVHNLNPAKNGDKLLTKWYRDDLGNPGQNMIVLYLPHDFGPIPDLTADTVFFGKKDGWHKWNDHIGSMIIRPGAKFNGESLHLAQDPAPKNGFTRDYGVGYFSLAYLDQGKMFNKASQMNISP